MEHLDCTLVFRSPFYSDMDTYDIYYDKQHSGDRDSSKLSYEEFINNNRKKCKSQKKSKVN